MNDDAEYTFEGLVKPLTDEQFQRKEDLVLELMLYEDPHEALNMITLALADFLSQVAPDKNSAMGATVWMMACITITLEDWDKEKLCNWNETRQ